MESHEYGLEDAVPGDGPERTSSPLDGDSQGNPPPKKSAVRKRTKTGCLSKLRRERQMHSRGLVQELWRLTDVSRSLSQTSDQVR